MRNTVLLLTVLFKYDLENNRAAVGQIFKKVGRPLQPVMHGSKFAGFVIVTEESAAQLMERLRPALDRIAAVDNYWCMTAASDITAKHGLNDPAVFRIGDAWDNIRQRSHPKHMRKPKTGEVFRQRGIKDSQRSAAVKMGIKPRGSRQSPKNLDDE